MIRYINRYNFGVRIDGIVRYIDQYSFEKIGRIRNSKNLQRIFNVNLRKMADTAHKDKEYMEEHFDTEEELDKKALTVSKWIRESTNLTAFIGAGLSTSAGIPDFRGPQGVWTLRAKGEQPKGMTSTLKAIPTPSHMSLVQLQNLGILKYIISQNTDGLLRRCGIISSNISELHGNSNIEKCEKCSKEFLRDYSTRSRGKKDHKTGRICSICGGDLIDSIINFGESLPMIPLEKAYENSKKSDLMLALGSSLTVSPANEMPSKVVKYDGKLVIVNLQKTPLDHLANIRVYSKIDDFMIKVMKYLEIEIPKFILKRYLLIEVSNGDEISIRGIDTDNTPVSFVDSWRISDQVVTGDTLKFKHKVGNSFEVELRFLGHYNEPNLSLHINLEGRKKIIMGLSFDPMTGTWSTS